MRNNSPSDETVQPFLCFLALLLALSGLQTTPQTTTVTETPRMQTARNKIGPFSEAKSHTSYELAQIFPRTGRG